MKLNNKNNTNITEFPTVLLYILTENINKMKPMLLSCSVYTVKSASTSTYKQGAPFKKKISCRRSCPQASCYTPYC